MKKEKLTSSKFASMKIEETKMIIGGGGEVLEAGGEELTSAGTSIFRDINPDPCTKWRCDSTCYCSDVNA